MFNQFMGNVVQYAVAVLDNRRQFQSKPVFHDFGKGIPINGVSVVIAHFHQFVIGACNLRVVRFPFFCQGL